jgi:hypothetical protein
MVAYPYTWPHAVRFLDADRISINGQQYVAASLSSTDAIVLDKNVLVDFLDLVRRTIVAGQTYTTSHEWLFKADKLVKALDEFFLLWDLSKPTCEEQRVTTAIERELAAAKRYPHLRKSAFYLETTQAWRSRARNNTSSSFSTSMVRSLDTSLLLLSAPTTPRFTAN